MEEKISFLVHQHEGLQYWRITVDERLEKSEETNQRITRKVEV